jgi:hypothetical protein
MKPTPRARRRTSRNAKDRHGGASRNARSPSLATTSTTPKGQEDTHNYQRFAPQDPEGRADPEDGIRQFVVGTGGRSLYQIPNPIANTEVYNDDTHGVLELTLQQKRYEWEFVPVEGESFTDSGAAQCH